MPLTAEQPRTTTPPTDGRRAAMRYTADAVVGGDGRRGPRSGWIAGWVAAALFAALLRGVALYTPAIAQEIATPDPRPTPTAAVASTPRTESTGAASLDFVEVHENTTEGTHTARPALLIRRAPATPADHADQRPATDEHGAATELRTMDNIAARLVTSS